MRFSTPTFVAAAIASVVVASPVPVTPELETRVHDCGPGTSCFTVPGLLVQLRNDLTAPFQKLRYINANNATAENIDSVHDDVRSSLINAIETLTSYVGANAPTLGSIDGGGFMTVDQLAKLVAGDLHYYSGDLARLEDHYDHDDEAAQSLIQDTGDKLGDLLLAISAQCEAVDEANNFLAAVRIDTKDIKQTILDLGTTTLGNILSEDTSNDSDANYEQ
ncbi:hypothetical protein K525DRAFT_264957 [Schizophyllum commune Loenen D]|nr:hypothetical protein K525DRAFT_264957 [Schizophyllum commune Loenen D]